jgi:riboflavin biosynthesis pyrimidine reductase
MVTTSGGNTVGPDGTSNSVTRGLDREILTLLRSLADGVVVGAGTLRAERIPYPSTSPLVVLSARGDIATHNLVTTADGGDDLVVITTDQGIATAKEKLAGIPHRIFVSPDASPPEDLAQQIRHILGAGHLLIEGGAHLWKHLAPVTDDLWLAVVPPPLSDAEGMPEWWPRDSGDWELGSMFTDEAKMLYFLHRRLRGAPSKP